MEGEMEIHSKRSCSPKNGNPSNFFHCNFRIGLVSRLLHYAWTRGSLGAAKGEDGPWGGTNTQSTKGFIYIYI